VSISVRYLSENGKHNNTLKIVLRNSYDKSSFTNINGRDVQRKNVVNNVDKSSLWAP